MGSHDSDEELGARLDSALHAGVGLDRVDVEMLLHGSRRRAQRIRKQRIVGMAAAAVLVVSLPVGYEVANVGEDAVAPAAAMLPSSAGPTMAHRAVPPARPIPDGFAFHPAELPAGLVVDSGAESDAGLLVEGQPCGGAQHGLKPAVSRRWVWSADPGAAGDLSVSLTVTGWATGKAAPAFAAAVKTAKACSAGDSQTPHSLPEMSAPEISASDPSGSKPLGEQRWATTSDLKGQHYCRALVQIGDRIVGIQVQHPKSAAAAAELADKLVEIQISHLRHRF